MKKIKYRVTTFFGENNEGDVVDGYVLLMEGTTALVYHPKTSKYTCASIEFCMLDPKTGHWIRADHDICYINIDKQKQLDKLAANFSKIKYSEAK